MKAKLIELIAVALLPIAFLVGGLSAFPAAFYQAWGRIIRHRRSLWGK